MDSSGEGSANNESGSHSNEGKRKPPDSSSLSPRIVNDTKDDDNKCQTSSGEVEETRLDAPSVKSIGDQDNKDVEDDTSSEDGRIKVPRKYDVLLGRGRPLQDHPGNLRFHKVINRSRSSYLNSRKEGKAGIAREVLYEIKTSKKSSKSKSKSKSKSHQSASGDSDGDGDGDEVNSPSSGGEPGRFLKKIGDPKASEKDVYWIQVSDDVAIEKISHALRGRPRSETRYRSDGSGGMKWSRNSGPEKGQSSGAPKRKGPPSPPTDETAPGTNVAEVNAGLAAQIEKGEENTHQASFTSSVNTPTRVSRLPNTTESTTADNTRNISAQPPLNSTDTQVQSLLNAWKLQQYQATMQFHHQNSQQMKLLQLIQRLMQQQQQAQISTPGVGAAGTASAFGQSQQRQLSTGVAGQLSAQQQQQLLLLQQQQAQHLLQQQPQQIQPQQVQYILQQGQLQPRQSQQQQQSPAATLPSNTTPGGTAIDPNFTSLTNAILSAIQQTAGSSSVNPAVNTQNILSATYANLAAQTQASPNQIALNPQQLVVPPLSGQVVGTTSSPQVQMQIQQLQQQQQIQQQLQHIQQQSRALLAIISQPQASQQHTASTPNSTSSATPPPPGNPPNPNNPS